MKNSWVVDTYFGKSDVARALRIGYYNDAIDTTANSLPSERDER